ncbi:MAG: zinc ribbon domain-containing protein [Treponema sp.]|nr:zinc ribbon domain-containing protein [Treponema sp.]
MDFVCVCNHCGKTIQQDFIYCPWCGKQNTELNDKSVLENVFSQLEVKQTNDRQTRVKNIESKIAEIEKGLQDLGIGKQ